MKLEQVAAQLFTVRGYCQNAADLAATARKLRAIGYRAVQVSAIGPIPAENVREICAGEGLTICATHEPSDMIRRTPERVVERLQQLGCALTAFPSAGGVDLRDAAQLAQLIADLDHAGEVLARAGIALCYHNHALEFLRVDDAGATALEAIFARTAPQRLGAELDTYWVQFGGADPVQWCRRLAGRLPIVHLKDYAFTAENKPAFAEIGAGNLDFRAIVAAAEHSGCRWFVVEQDICPGDPFDSLRASFAYIRDHLVTS